MKRRQFTAIFTALAVTVCSSVLLVGCAGETYNYKKVGDNYEYVGLASEDTESKASTASTADTSVASTVSTAESSVAASSAPVSTVESSVAPVSTVESSVESTVESSVEESSEAPVAEGTVIKFRKPGTEKWAFDDVCAYVVGENAAGEKDVKNAQWPGVAMTAEGDGIYSYVVPNDILNATVIFNCNTGKVQFPRSKGVDVEAGKTYEVE
jgi:hypothetical protein